MVILGLFILVPALLIPSKKQQPVPQTSQSKGPVASQPSQSPPVQSAHPATTPSTMGGPSMGHTPISMPAPVPQVQQSAALFPTTMFPSLSQYQAPQPVELKHEIGGPRDDFLDLVALVVLVKLLSG